MPTEPEIKGLHRRNCRPFTVHELVKLGMDPAAYEAGDWDDRFFVEETGTVNEGSMRVVFEYEGKYWLIDIDFNPQEWFATNDLTRALEGRRKETFEAVEVERYMRVDYRPIAYP